MWRLCGYDASAGTGLYTLAVLSEDELEPYCSNLQGMYIQQAVRYPSGLTVQTYDISRRHKYGNAVVMCIRQDNMVMMQFTVFLL